MSNRTAEDDTLVELMQQGAREAKELVRAELRLAVHETRADIAKAKVAALSLGAAAVCALLGALALIDTLVAWSLVAGLIVGLVLLATAAAAVAFGVRALPKSRLPQQIRNRLLADARTVQQALR